MNRSERILVIIPAFNEEDSVGRVIEDVRTNCPQMDILVVNDGSTDRTSEKARAKGVVVLDLPFNLGVGGGMQAGYKYADAKGYDIAIQVDGDGQHDSKEISKLLHTLEEEKVDVAIGSRFITDLEYKGTTMRRLGIAVLSNAISLVIRQKITDPTSGFRASRRKAVELFAVNYPQDYPEPEVLVLLRKSGLKLAEVAVKMGERYSGESSITKIRSVYYMVKVLLAVFVDWFKRYPLRMGG